MTSARKSEGMKASREDGLLGKGGARRDSPGRKCEQCGGPTDPEHRRCRTCRRRAAEPALATVDDFTHRRYHEAQADPEVDTAAKRLARAADVDYVQCGCGERFPSVVIPA